MNTSSNELQEILVMQIKEHFDVHVEVDEGLIPHKIDSFLMVQLMDIIDEVCGDFRPDYNIIFSDDEVTVQSIVGHIKNQNR